MLQQIRSGKGEGEKYESGMRLWLEKSNENLSAISRSLFLVRPPAKMKGQGKKGERKGYCTEKTNENLIQANTGTDSPE